MTNATVTETKRTNDGRKPLAGEPTLCGARTRQGGTCKQPAMPNGRCRLHGGKTPGGVLSANFKTGRYSKYMPQRLLERYEQSIDDPELLNMRHEIALVDSRLTDLLTRVDTGEAGANWTAARKANDDIRKALLNENYGAVMEASLFMDRIIGQELTDIEAWEQIQSLLDQRRKLVEAEQKRLVAMQQMISAEQAMTFAVAIIDIVRRNVTDRTALNAISLEMGKLVNAESVK